MSACCEDDELEVLDDGVLVSQQVTKLSFDGGIAATQDPVDPDLVHVSLGGPGAVSLQIAYDGGEVITTDAQGAVDLIRGILTPDGESLLTLADANANPGRTVSLLAIDDSNVVGAAEPGSIRVTRTTVGIAITLRSLGAGVEMQEVATVPGGASAATFGKWWVRNDVPNVPMFTDDAGVDHVLTYVGGTSLQNAYDAGEAIVLDAQGSVDITRGASIGDGDPALLLTDANANPGRTTAVLDIQDTNVVGAVVAGVAVSVESIARDNVTNTPVWTRWLSTADNASGPIVELSLQRATPTAEDIAGSIRFVARDSALNVTLYAELRGVGERVTNNIEIGRFDLLTRFGANNPKFLSFFARGAAAALDGGVIYGWLAAGANPTVEVRALNNFGAGQPVFRVTDNDGGSTLQQVDGDGDVVVTQDIEAAGGYQKTIGIWTSALIANQTDVALVLAATIANDWTVFRAGSITGIATRLNAVVTAGTLTINVRVNGAIVFTSAVTAVTTVTTQAKDVDAIVAGDLITVSYTSNALFAGPVTASVEVEIEE